jgi:hypothetical protein
MLFALSFVARSGLMHCHIAGRTVGTGRVDRRKACEPIPQVVDANEGLPTVLCGDEIAALDRLVERGSANPGGGAGLGDGQCKLFQDCLAIFAGLTPAVRPAFVRAMAHQYEQKFRLVAPKIQRVLTLERRL